MADFNGTTGTTATGTTFNYSITLWPNLKYRFKQWALGIAYVIEP